MGKLTEKEYNILCGKIACGVALDVDEAGKFLDILSRIEAMLDEGDMDDYFGTEGWRHNLGWDR